eukprot:m.197653 g.197653  ORF g.197653 m.197653 type:complete len:301 (+) comp10649_c0_seq3:995-1897(+)
MTPAKRAKLLSKLRCVFLLEVGQDLRDKRLKIVADLDVGIQVKIDVQKSWIQNGRSTVQGRVELIPPLEVMAQQRHLELITDFALISEFFDAELKSEHPKVDLADGSRRRVNCAQKGISRSKNFECKVNVRPECIVETILATPIRDELLVWRKSISSIRKSLRYKQSPNNILETNNAQKHLDIAAESRFTRFCEDNWIVLLGRAQQMEQGSVVHDEKHNPLDIFNRRSKGLKGAPVPQKIVEAVDTAAGEHNFGEARLEQFSRLAVHIRIVGDNTEDVLLVLLNLVGSDVCDILGSLAMS